MVERVYFPIHGQSRGGTGNVVYGGFGYGNAKADPVTLKPDRPTDLFAPSLTTEVEEAAKASAGDKWIYDTPAGKTVHAPHVRANGRQPATVALTKERRIAAADARKRAAKEKAAAAKANAQVARIQKAIMAGKLTPKEARAKAKRAAEHGLRMRHVAHEAYNAIAIIQARINAAREAGTPGKSLVAHQRVLNRMRAQTDRLESIAARDRALAHATEMANAGGISDYIQLEDYIQLDGLGQEPVGDARDVEEQAAELVAQAATELAADNVGAAEVTIANAEGAFQHADQRMSAEQAAGDVFSEVSAALEPDRVPWGKIAVGVLILAALRQATR